MRDRVMWRHMGRVFAGITLAGAASRRPYESKIRKQIPHP